MIPVDSDLVERIQERDAHAFELLMARYQESLRRYLSHIVRDSDATEDLLQEVFLRVWTRAEQWNGRGPFKAWLFRSATNLALNYLRSVQRRKQQPLEMATHPYDEGDDAQMPNWMIDLSSLGPDEVFEHAERYERLQRVIRTLPDEKREVFRMVREEEMDIREVAEMLGIPEGTVKSRLHYATKHVARQWLDTERTWEDA
ncbi:MAG TPA: sigma-70 family RNA polymerase sigma factor [Ktedonobacteraceae bacterium]|nr:sigma-70 family RNA polymerase sigma factor [Ktedonobacteraceae bacterium]